MSDTSNCRVDIFKDTYKVISKMRKILSQKGYYHKILSQEQLDGLINSSEDGVLGCFVMLNGGAMSSKSITLEEDDSYFIINEIDDTEENIPHDKLMDSFPIGEAIKKGALYEY